MAEGGLSIPSFHILEGHDASAPQPRHLQGALQNLASGSRSDAFIGALRALSDSGRLPGENGAYEGRGAMRPRAGVPWRLCVVQSRGGCLVYCLQAIPSPELVSMEQRFWGVVPMLAARWPSCNAVHLDTCHARLCPRWV